MNQERNKQIQLAKELLKSVRHAAMATVNVDGSPHNTPFFFIYNSDFTKLFWGSHPESLHSQNVARDGKLFVVIFDSFTQGKGGLYITAVNAHVLSGGELTEALKVHNSFRAKEDKEPLEESYYIDGEQRMYSTDIQKIEAYSVIRDDTSHVRKESRTPITTSELLSKNRTES